MKYADAREFIASGDVIFQSHRPLRSWYDFKIFLVRAFTRSEWSHAAMAWVVGGRVFVIEAVSSGVRIFPLSRAGDFTWVQLAGFTTDMEEHALSHVGEPYSQWDAIKSVFGNVDSLDRRWFCSEFVIAMRRLRVDDKTPSGLWCYLTEVKDLTGRFVSNP